MSAGRLTAFRREGLVFDVADGGPPDGEPVVLLHGFPQDRTAWDRLVPVLHAAGRRTLAPDVRGYSPAARPGGRRAYRRRELVGDVLALLDAAGVEAAHVVGHDWGAAVAWSLTASHPDRVRTLTALSVPHPRAYLRAVRTGRQGVRALYIPFLVVPLLPEAALRTRDGALLRSALRRTGLPPERIAHYTRRMLEPGALSGALGAYRALPVDAREAVRRVRVPTVMVWGGGDPALDRAGAEACGDFVRAPYRLEILEGAGHWLPETATDRLAPLLIEHVGRSAA
jgi:pimeloyl-ACP methyl ester carboxylesterase